MSERELPFWLNSGHAQTVAPAFDRTQPLPLECRRHELADGDFVDVHWFDRRGTGPIFVVLPGMEGTEGSSYVQHLVRAIADRGARAVVLRHRGAAVPNRLARFYHAGSIDDLAWLVAALRDGEPNTPIYAVGFSLGGSILTRYLAETGESSGLVATAAVSMTFCLESTARLASSGFSRLYQARVLRSFKRVARAKAHLTPYARVAERLAAIGSVRAFDDALTAPIHGFRDAADYYRRSSSRRFLRAVRAPLLVLTAKDDPLVATDTFPVASELGPNTVLEAPPRGGHLGFIGRDGATIRPLFPKRVISFCLEGATT